MKRKSLHGGPAAIQCLLALALATIAAVPYRLAWAANEQPAPSSAAAGMRNWIQHTGDNRNLPFVIIDKHQARIWIHNPQGLLVESAPVLLGLAIGDQSVPGIGERPLAHIRPSERTTPAGRFRLEPGRNMNGEEILWLDYSAAVSLHRVRPGMPGEGRLQRLHTESTRDNRISYGCINVPIAVYNRSIHKLFTPRGGYAYVMPEVQNLQKAFPFLRPLVKQPPSAETPDDAALRTQPRSARAGRGLPVVPLPLLPLPSVLPLPAAPGD